MANTKVSVPFEDPVGEGLGHSAPLWMIWPRAARGELQVTTRGGPVRCRSMKPGYWGSPASRKDIRRPVSALTRPIEFRPGSRFGGRVEWYAGRL
jgi:hypothetical protein